jgi:hypothetical protein
MFQIVMGRNPHDIESPSICLINDDKTLWLHIYNDCLWPECGDGEGESEPRALSFSDFDGSIEDMLSWFLDEEY